MLPAPQQPAERDRRPAAAGRGGPGRPRRHQEDPRRHAAGRVNDVLLTVVTGALREWLLSRGEPVVGRHVGARAGARLVQDGTRSPATEVSSFLVDLPVGEPNPRVRLTRLSYAMRGHRPARPVGGCRQPHRADRVRATDPARPRRPGGPRAVPAVVQPRGDQRARAPGSRSTPPAAGCSRCSRWFRWRAARACRSA